MKVLIAEDEPISNKILVNTLTQWGYEVIQAQDGKQAWEILQRENAPKIAILDWMMPGMSGVEICQKTRQQENNRQEYEQKPYTYFLLLTVRASKTDIIRGLEAGADDYMTKPYTPEELKARIHVGERILSLHRPQPSEKIIDLEELMDRFGGDMRLLRKIANMFIKKLPEELRAIDEAIQRRDAKPISETAHSLKSSIGYFTSEAPFQAALELEKVGRNGDWQHIQRAYDRLTDQLQKLQEVLEVVSPSDTGVSGR